MENITNPNIKAQENGNLVKKYNKIGSIWIQIWWCVQQLLKYCSFQCSVHTPHINLCTAAAQCYSTRSNINILSFTPLCPSFLGRVHVSIHISRNETKFQLYSTMHSNALKLICWLYANRMCIQVGIHITLCALKCAECFPFLPTWSAHICYSTCLCKFWEVDTYIPHTLWCCCCLSLMLLLL